MCENAVYISQLRPDFDVIDLESELLDASPDEDILDYVIHNNNTVFLAFVNSQFVELKVIHQCQQRFNKLLQSLLGSHRAYWLKQSLDSIKDRLSALEEKMQLPINSFSGY